MEKKDANSVLEIIKSEFIYDKENGKLFRIRGRRKGFEGGFNHSKGYRSISIAKEKYFVHRIIWLIENKKWPENQIDHINGIKNDNRIDNLRDVTNRENHQNKLIHKNGKLFGCTYLKNRKKWQSAIKHNGKEVYLGTYDSEKQAHEAYKKYQKENNL